MQNKEEVKGVALPGVFQLRIVDEWTKVINFKNDSIQQVCKVYCLNISLT